MGGRILWPSVCGQGMNSNPLHEQTNFLRSRLGEDKGEAISL